MLKLTRKHFSYLAALLLVITAITWLQGCGLCMEGMGNCSSNQNPVQTLAITFNPAAIYAGYQVQIFPVGGTPPYTIITNNASLQSQNLITPSTVGAGQAGVFASPNPPPTPYSSDTVGQYSQVQFQVTDSLGAIATATYKIYTH